MNAGEEMARLGDRLAAEIERMREALAAGAVVETDRLADLTQAVQALAPRLDPGEAAVARPRLLGLLADLDAVQAEMAAAQAALQAELGETSARHRAVNAYIRPTKR
ncbi:MAG: hypothetical protein ACK4QW_00700 [Alphaproteobacteria bacterium]